MIRLIFVLLVTITLLVFAMVTGDAIYTVSFFVLLLMLLISAISLLTIIYSFKYSQKIEPTESIKGQQTKLTLQLGNELFFPFPFIRMDYLALSDINRTQQKVRTLCLLPNRSETVRETFLCSRRGTYTVGLNSIRVSDVFGLIVINLPMKRFSYFKPITLTVRPRIIPLTWLPVTVNEGVRATHAAVRRTQEINDISDLRKYNSGDSLHRIHWKVSMRQRELIVKNYEQASLPNILIYLDLQELADAGEMGFMTEDMAVECAVATLYFFLNQNLRLELITYNSHSERRFGTHMADFQIFYDYLTDVRFTSQYCLDDILEQESQRVQSIGSAYFITRSLTSRAAEVMVALRHSAVDICVMYVHGEMDESPEQVRIVSELLRAGIAVVDLNPSDDLKGKVGALR